MISGIPDSLSCIPDSKTQDSRSKEQKVFGFRIPHAEIFRIRESRFSYMGRNPGSHIPQERKKEVLLPNKALLLDFSASPTLPHACLYC